MEKKLHQYLLNTFYLFLIFFLTALGPVSSEEDVEDDNELLGIIFVNIDICIFAVYS